MAAEKKAVVLVEDERILANLVERELKKHGYEVKTVHDGKKAVDLIKNSKPDLVLLDMVLPGLNGFEILETLYKDGILPALPIIIISNSGQQIEVERAKKLGVRDYLIKVNFDPREVVEKVIQTFESKNLRKNKTEKSAAFIQTARVVLVEDDTILADTLEKKFQQKGYHLYKCSSAEAARRILKDTEVDVILLDLVLPDVNGFTFLEELQRDSRLKNIPVVIISNLGQRDEIEQGLRAGARDYIIKTNTVPGEIVQKVERITKHLP